MDSGNVEMRKGLMGKEGARNGNIHIITRWEGAARQTKVKALLLPLSGFVTLGTLLNLPEP